MYENYDKELLIARVKELEEQVEHLRISRRVLMNLIEKIEREKRHLLTRLEKENKRLQLSNSKYAQWLWNKNRKIIELEAQIHQEY
ncbi:MAG: translation initiation factor 2 [Bacillota bacterium]